MSLVTSLRRAGAGLLSTMIVVLPTFWTMAQLALWWRPPFASIVIAVMLGLALPRTLDAIPPRRWPGAALAVLIAAAVASTLTTLVASSAWPRALGAAGFAIAVGLPVWMRRFGPAWRSFGIAAGVPFIAVLVAPQPDGLTWDGLAWTLVAATTALAWALAVAGSRLLGGSPSVAPTGTARPTRMRPSADTRLAIQLTGAVGVAFAAAFLIDPGHVSWTVLTALLVSSNNRGRGDVCWKGTQRLVGALAGAAIATLLLGQLPQGDPRASVAVFATIALAAALRPFGYAYWAACVSAGLAFLYGFLGESGPALIAGRLLGIAVGGLIAIVIAWFVLPLRTTVVVRARVANVLESAGASLAQLRDGHVPRVDQVRAARAELAKLRPTVRAARVFGVGSVRTLAPLVDNALELADQVSSYATSRAETEAIREAAKRVVGLREALRPSRTT